MATTSLYVNNQTQIQDQDSFPLGARSVINIYAKSNEGLNFVVKWKKKNGLAMDLTGYKALMTIRDRKDGHVVLARLGTDSGLDGTIVCLYDGSITCTLQSSYLRDGYKTGTWLYDLLLEDSNGVKTRLVQGNFYIDRSCSYIEGQS